MSCFMRSLSQQEPHQILNYTFSSLQKGWRANHLWIKLPWFMIYYPSLHYCVVVFSGEMYFLLSLNVTGISVHSLFDSFAYHFDQSLYSQSKKTNSFQQLISSFSKWIYSDCYIQHNLYKLHKIFFISHLAGVWL